MPQISQRSGRFTESVIRRMTRVSDEHKAINLSQGFPDFDPPREMMDALLKVAYRGPHQYAVTYGAPNFRAALAAMQGALIAREIDPEEETLVTCGATEAMICALMAVCNPGDRVGVFSPFYENYAADCILCGAEAVYIPLLLPDYRIDDTALEAAFAQGIKAIVVCNPSNPSGKVFTRDELTYISRLAKQHKAWVITDEVYERIVYKPHEHVRVCSLPGMFDHCLTVSSLSKSYSITGWRLGYLIGPRDAVAAARKVHDFLTVGAPAPLQEAAIPGLLMEENYYRMLLTDYMRKRDLFLSGLDKIGIRHNEPQGSYFVLAEIGDFLSLPRFSGFDDEMFCVWMAEHIGVAAVPGSSFFKLPVSPKMRLHFARGEECLLEALRRLSRLASL